MVRVDELTDKFCSFLSSHEEAGVVASYRMVWRKLLPNFFGGIIKPLRHYVKAKNDTIACVAACCFHQAKFGQNKRKIDFSFISRKIQNNFIP